MARKRKSRGELEREIVEGLKEIYIEGEVSKETQRRIASGVDNLRVSGSKCLLPADDGRGKCPARPIEGHSVPRNVLKKVEQSQDEGWIVPTDTIASKMLHYASIDDGEPSVERKPKTHALTGYFSCRQHDDNVFRKADNIASSLDFHDPERQFLLAYRAVLHTFAEVNGVFRAFHVVKDAMDRKGELGKAMREPLWIWRRHKVRSKMKRLEHLQGEIGNLRSCLGKDRQNKNYRRLHTHSFQLDLSNANYPMNFAVSVLRYDAALKTPLMATVIPLGNFIHRVIASSPKDGVVEDWKEIIKDLKDDSLPLLRDGIFGAGNTCIVKEDYENIRECERSAAIHANWQSVKDDIDNF